MKCSVATIEKWYKNQERVILTLYVILTYINMDLVCATTVLTWQESIACLCQYENRKLFKQKDKGKVIKFACLFGGA